jgi:hydrogenase maturation protease
VLLIGYGNPLRRDDGLGPFIVESLARDHGDVQTLTAVQLLPEMAASLAKAETALFIDACAGGEVVELTLVEERDVLEWSSHTADPRRLLALTRAVYGRSPRSWWITVPGVDFQLGEGFSPLAQQNPRTTRDRIEKMLPLLPGRSGQQRE